jgi:glycosyltransferase involved in cell wall biosynthesis
MPEVSVVVATRDRPARLAALLAGLRRQRAPGAFEVVVVDDGSGPETVSRLQAELDRGELDLRVVRHEEPRGPGAARNAGWRAARAPLVAFTDDDCVPEPGWIAAGLAAHRARADAIVQGRTEPEPAELHRNGVLTRTLRVVELGPQYPTCNIFYPRELLERMGGFDEEFGLRPGGEDTDLAWRAIESGRPAVLAEDALVHHAVERLGLAGTLRDATRWTATTRIFARHPGTRAMLDHGIFWNVWHYLLVRSALSLLLPRPVRRLVLLRHVLALRRRARAAGSGSWAIPILLAYDAVETAAVVRGAVRHRTIVL